jgi:hypothetical protein
MLRRLPPTAAVNLFTAENPWREPFVREISRRIDAAGVLTFSHRQALLRLARRLRLAPFDANLLIASVQHRIVGSLPRCDRHAPQARLSRSAHRSAIVCAALVQVAIVLCAWWGLLR